MSLIVLLFGASGSGKSTLMEQLMKAGNQYSIHIKGTDRPAREYDGVEIRCAESISPNEYDYVYQTYGFQYGIQRSQIDDALKNNRHHFIICNDIPTILAIKRDYEACVRVVFQYFDAPRKALLDIQNARGISDDEIGLRLAKTEVLYRMFLEEWELFDGVLYNHYGDDPATTRYKMEKLLERLALKQLPGETSDRIVSAIVSELQQQFIDRSPLNRATEPDYVFIIMAMTENEPALEDTHSTVKRTCERLGMRAERVDDTEFTGQITEKILGSIQVAEIIIADLTYERPNVYYEIGYAHALGKPVLLIAQHGTKAHFDVQGMRILFYRNMTRLEELLTKAIQGIVQIRGNH